MGSKRLRHILQSKMTILYFVTQYNRTALQSVTAGSWLQLDHAGRIRAKLCRIKCGSGGAVASKKLSYHGRPAQDSGAGLWCIRIAKTHFSFHFKEKL